MHIPNREVATWGGSQACSLGDPGDFSGYFRPKKMLIDAIIPIFGIRWNAHVMRRVGGESLREIPWSLCNSKLDKASYSEVRDLWRQADTDEAEFPQLWEAWRTVIWRFNLDDEKRLPTWVGIIDTFIKQAWESPQKLATVHIDQLEAVVTDSKGRIAATQLWAASVLLFTDLSSASYLLLNGVSKDAEKLILQLRTAPARFKAVHSDMKGAIKHLKFSNDFANLAPWPRFRS